MSALRDDSVSRKTASADSLPWHCDPRIYVHQFEIYCCLDGFLDTKAVVKEMIGHSQGPSKPHEST